MQKSIERNGYKISINEESNKGYGSITYIDIEGDKLEVSYIEGLKRDGTEEAFVYVDYFAGYEEVSYTVSEVYRRDTIPFWRPWVCKCLGEFIGTTNRRFLYTYEWKDASAAIIDVIALIMQGLPHV